VAAQNRSEWRRSVVWPNASTWMRVESRSRSRSHSFENPKPCYCTIIS